MSKHISRINQWEQRIAHLVEGSFARLFAGRLHAREVATHLARALDDAAKRGPDGLLVAPNVFTVRLNPNDLDALNAANPDLALELVANVAEMAQNAQMRFLEPPTLDLLGDARLSAFSIQIEARHVTGANPPTESLQLPELQAPPENVQNPQNAQLVIQGTRYISLDRPVVNIGRRSDNHVVIDDPRVSRVHAQLRLRFNRFVIFDLGSKAGTMVNGHRITEHILRSGDVISLSGVAIVYMEDEGSSEMGDTRSMPPSSTSAER